MGSIPFEQFKFNFYSISFRQFQFKFNIKFIISNYKCINSNSNCNSVLPTLFLLFGVPTLSTYLEYLLRVVYIINRIVTEEIINSNSGIELIPCLPTSRFIDHKLNYTPPWLNQPNKQPNHNHQLLCDSTH